MHATVSLFRREFGAYFISPIAYVVITVFLFVVGSYFNATIDQLTARGPKGVEAPLQLMLGDKVFWLVLMFIPPLLTMRLFAEERSTGTLEMLMTAPITEWEVVLSKYLASFAFYVVMWLPALLYLPFILGARTAVGRVDFMPVITSVLGLMLAGAMFLAIGLFVSSLVRNQLVAALISLCGTLIFVVAGFGRPEVSGGVLDMGSPVFDLVSPLFDRMLDRIYEYLAMISVPLHFRDDFSRGLMDTRYVVLYVSVTVFCLFLTVRSLERSRWR